MSERQTKKSQVIHEIENYLREELGGTSDAGERSRIEGLLLQYRFMPRREFGPEDVVVPSALVELDLNGSRALYFVAPAGGGLVMRVEDQPVQVITPQSPLGEALLGKKAGDSVRVQIGSGIRVYAVISIT